MLTKDPRETMVGVGINPLLSLSYICPPSRTLFVFWVKWECIPLGILIRFSTFPRYKLNLPISKGHSNGQNNLFFLSTDQNNLDL